MACAIFLAVACQRNEMQDGVVPALTDNVRTLAVGVVDGDQTRVGFDDGNSFYWHQGDRIGVFTVNGFREMTLNEGYHGQAAGVFTGVFEQHCIGIRIRKIYHLFAICSNGHRGNYHIHFPCLQRGNQTIPCNVFNYNFSTDRLTKSFCQIHTYTDRVPGIIFGFKRWVRQFHRHYQRLGILLILSTTTDNCT